MTVVSFAGSRLVEGSSSPGRPYGFCQRGVTCQGEWHAQDVGLRVKILAQGRLPVQLQHFPARLDALEWDDGPCRAVWPRRYRAAGQLGLPGPTCEAGSPHQADRTLKVFSSMNRGVPANGPEDLPLQLSISSAEVIPSGRVGKGATRAYTHCARGSWFPTSNRRLAVSGCVRYPDTLGNGSCLPQAVWQVRRQPEDRRAGWG